ncbi:MAG: hypothetical protein ABIS42_06440, partial [Candidatus Limnocylindria bacterium]
MGVGNGLGRGVSQNLLDAEVTSQCLPQAVSRKPGGYDQGIRKRGRRFCAPIGASCDPGENKVIDCRRAAQCHGASGSPHRVVVTSLQRGHDRQLDERDVIGRIEEPSP